MIMIKKSSRFLALMLIALTCNVYSMKRLHEEEKTRTIPVGSRILLPTGRWVEIVGEILLDEANIQDLTHFTDLPPEILAHIIYLLTETKKALSLKDIAKNIRSLAVVNKDLNALINHPSFCLNLIKHFSQKFNLTDEEVAEALGTKEAQRRLELQKKLYEECTKHETDIQNIKAILSEGADVNFSMYGQDLLLITVYQEKVFSFPIIKLLVENGANKDQQTDLLVDIITYFCRNDITAVNEYLLKIVKILLNSKYSKADPEVTDREGNSMLSLIQNALNEVEERHEIRENNSDLFESNSSEEEEEVDLDVAEVLETTEQLLKDAIKRKQSTGQKK